MAPNPTLRDALLAFGLDPESDEEDTPPQERESPAAPASATGAMSDLSPMNIATISIAPQPLLTVRGQSISARDLLRMDFPDPVWAVTGLLPMGLTVFAGAPKIGKSWAALQLAVSIASGKTAMGHFTTRQGGVLYLALEDNHRRLQKRLRLMLNGGPCPDGLAFQCQWPRLDDGGLDRLAEHLEADPETRVIIVDTMQRLRHGKNRNGNAYEADYAELGPLQEFAIQHGVALVVIHHLRKSTGESGDPLEQVSGSTAISGVADATIVLKRSRGHADGTMFVTGRDMEEAEHAVSFDKDRGRWTVLGDAATVRVSEARARILECLAQAGEPLTAAQIAVRVDGKADNVKRTLYRMVEDGHITNRHNKLGQTVFTLREAA